MSTPLLASIRPTRTSSLKTIARNVFIVLLSVTAFGLFRFRESTKPPREATVIENFNTHRTEYDQLRAMLKEDAGLKVIAKWGIRTNDSPLNQVPPDGGLPVARFQQYLSLFAASGTRGADQTRGPQPVVCLWAWSSGFAGDTRHVEICSVDKPPMNQVASLDEFYKSPKPRQPVYKHIDENWYIWADW